MIAFRASLERERPFLVAFVHAAARGRFIGPEAAEDLVQEAMTIAWERRGEFDASRALGPWLRGIASNVLIGAVRRETRRRRLLEAAAPEIERVHALADRFDQLADAFSVGEVRASLRDCIERLPASYRFVIERHYAQGQAFRLIAEECDLNEEATTKRASRARAMLADCLERKGVLRPEGRVSREDDERRHQ